MIIDCSKNLKCRLEGLISHKYIFGIRRGGHIRAVENVNFFGQSCVTARERGGCRCKAISGVGSRRSHTKFRAVLLQQRETAKCRAGRGITCTDCGPSQRHGHQARTWHEAGNGVRGGGRRRDGRGSNSKRSALTLAKFYYQHNNTNRDAKQGFESRIVFCV